MKTKVTRQQISEFKLFWVEYYGGEDIKTTNSIFELFLKKYKNDVQKAAEMLSEFCTRFDDVKGDKGVRGGFTREQEIEGDYWI